MKNYFRLNELSCIVYLDSVKKLDKGIYDIAIDFRLPSDVNTFNHVIRSNLTSSTYIELRNMKTSKRLRMGCYYQLNLNLLKETIFENYVDQEFGLFGGYFELSEMEYPINNNTEILQTHEPLNNEDLSWKNGEVIIQKKIYASNDMEVYIKDVGQANWNELRIEGAVKVLFDAGAELHASQPEAQRIFNTRRNDLEESRPLLVLSHWDMDHIHCLKYLSDYDIKKCFSALICPDRVKSVTSITIRENFIRALGKHNVYSLSLPTRTNGISMTEWCSMGCLTIYKGEANSNINFCGLVMFVEGKKKTVNFTGDCRLSQANDVYIKIKANTNEYKNHILISPHHGGDYGTKHRTYDLPCNDIAISVSINNIYGHPQKNMLKYLKQRGTVVQTSTVGDIIFKI